MENTNKKFNELGGIAFAAEKEENKTGGGNVIENVHKMLGALPEQQVL